MKTVMFNFSGTATPGDYVALSYVGPRGGQSNVHHVVKGGSTSRRIVDDPEPRVETVTVLPDTLEDIVTALANGINSATGEWSPGNGDFRAVAKGKMLVVMVSDLLSDVRFLAQAQGAGTELIDIEVIG